MLNTRSYKRIQRQKQLAEKRNDTENVRQKCCELAQMHIDMEQFDDALQELKEAMIMGGEKDPLVHRTLADYYSYMSNFSEELIHREKHLSITRDNETIAEEQQALNNLGTCFLEAALASGQVEAPLIDQQPQSREGLLQKSYQYFTDALALSPACSEHQRKHMEMRCIYNMGLVKMSAEFPSHLELRQSREHFKEAASIANILNDCEFKFMVCSRLAEVAALLNHDATTIKAIQQALSTQDSLLLPASSLAAPIQGGVGSVVSQSHSTNDAAQQNASLSGRTSGGRPFRGCGGSPHTRSGLQRKTANTNVIAENLTTRSDLLLHLGETHLVHGRDKDAMRILRGAYKSLHNQTSQIKSRVPKRIRIKLANLLRHTKFCLREKSAILYLEKTTLKDFYDRTDLPRHSSSLTVFHTLHVLSGENKKSPECDDLTETDFSMLKDNMPRICAQLERLADALCEQAPSRPAQAVRLYGRIVHWHHFYQQQTGEPFPEKKLVRGMSPLEDIYGSLAMTLTEMGVYSRAYFAHDLQLQCLMVKSTSSSRSWSMCRVLVDMYRSLCSWNRQTRAGCYIDDGTSTVLQVPRHFHGAKLLLHFAEEQTDTSGEILDHGSMLPASPSEETSKMPTHLSSFSSPPTHLSFAVFPNSNRKQVNDSGCDSSSDPDDSHTIDAIGLHSHNADTDGNAYVCQLFGMPGKTGRWSIDSGPWFSPSSRKTQMLYSFSYEQRQWIAVALLSQAILNVNLLSKSHKLSLQELQELQLWLNDFSQEQPKGAVCHSVDQLLGDILSLDVTGNGRRMHAATLQILYQKAQEVVPNLQLISSDLRQRTTIPEILGLAAQLKEHNQNNGVSVSDMEYTDNSNFPIQDKQHLQLKNTGSSVSETENDMKYEERNINMEKRIDEDEDGDGEEDEDEDGDEDEDNINTDVSLTDSDPDRTVREQEESRKRERAKLNRTNEKGETPLQEAARVGNFEGVQRLLSKGARADTRDNAGWTPLHDAADGGFDDIVTLLLDQPGVSVDARSSKQMDQRSALHEAARCGHTTVVRILLEAGADPLLCDGKGCTALDLAAQYDHEDVFSLLREAILKRHSLSNEQAQHAQQQNDHLSDQNGSSSIIEAESYINNSLSANTGEPNGDRSQFPTSDSVLSIPEDMGKYLEQRTEHMQRQRGKVISDPTKRLVAQLLRRSRRQQQGQLQRHIADAIDNDEEDAEERDRYEGRNLVSLADIALAHVPEQLLEDNPARKRGLQPAEYSIRKLKHHVDSTPLESKPLSEEQRNDVEEAFLGYDMVDRETTSASQYERIHTPNMSINKKYRNRLQNQRQKQNPWEHFESDSSSDSTDNFDYGSDDRAEYSRRQHRIPSNYTRTHFLHNKRRSHRRQCNYDGNLIPSCEGGSPDREMYRRLQNEEEMQQSMQEQLYFPKRIDVEHADDIILSDAESLRSHESTDSEDVAGVSLTMSETIYQSSPTESADDLDTTALDDPLQSSPLRSHGRCPQPSVTAIEEKLSKQHKHRSIGTTELSSIHRKRKFYEPLQRSRKKCMEHRSALHQRAFRKTGKSKQSKIAKGLPRIVKMLNDQSDFRISQSCHLFPDVDDILQSCQSDSFSLSQYTKSGQTSIRDLGSASVSARQIEIALADQSLVDNDSEQTHVYKQHGKINNFIRQQQMKQPLSKQQFELPVYGLTPSTLSTSILPQDNQQSLCFIQCAIKATNDVLLFPVNRVCNTTDDMFDMISTAHLCTFGCTFTCKNIVSFEGEPFEDTILPSSLVKTDLNFGSHPIRILNTVGSANISNTSTRQRFFEILAKQSSAQHLIGAMYHLPGYVALSLELRQEIQERLGMEHENDVIILADLPLHACDVLLVLSSLRFFATLTRLDLSGTSADDHCCEFIARNVWFWCHLHTLQIAHCDITHKGIASIFDARHPSIINQALWMNLKLLDISHNRLHGLSIRKIYSFLDAYTQVLVIAHCSGLSIDKPVSSRLLLNSDPMTLREEFFCNTLVFAQFQTIKKINLAGLDTVTQQFTRTINLMKAVIHPGLQAIDLRGCFLTIRQSVTLLEQMATTPAARNLEIDISHNALDTRECRLHNSLHMNSSANECAGDSLWKGIVNAISCFDTLILSYNFILSGCKLHGQNFVEAQSSLKVTETAPPLFIIHRAHTEPHQ